MNKYFRGHRLALLASTLIVVMHSIPAESARKIFTGTLVDLTCVTDRKSNLDKLRSEHTRKCLLMPICMESGYALLTDQNNEVIQFDSVGNTLARKLINKNPNEHVWRVSVEGSLSGSRVFVTNINFSKRGSFPKKHD